MKEIDRNKVQEPSNGRQHVVILGAGASLAAFPSGDKNGRKLPLMANIVEVIGLGGFLDKAGIFDGRDNFESLYSDLEMSGQHQQTVSEINEALFNYFAEMELPDEPTLYDHLVLSLREKDVIASFNWDPFLWQAMTRNWQQTQLPSVCYLHGNTAIGYCLDHKPIPVRSRYDQCPRCNKPMQDGKLLYPVKQKNYNNDAFIETNWKLLRKSLENASLVTIFGYGTPKTDVEAMGLLKSAWGDPMTRPIDEMEIIDVKHEDELRRTWEPFFSGPHYQMTNDFFKSTISRSPRRSCEAKFAADMDMVPIEPNPIHPDWNWDEFDEFYEMLIADERRRAKQRARAQ